jgi:hypothetical protein
MKVNFQDFLNENYLGDLIRNKFRGKDNPNILAEEIFDTLKAKIKNEPDLILDFKSEKREGYQMLEIPLTSTKKIKIEAIETDEENPNWWQKGQKGLGMITLSQSRQPNEILSIEIKRAQRYLNYLERKQKKKWNKAVKKRRGKNVRSFIDL